ncbi:MAG: hypothetical protein KBC64_07000 [Simkaniaceae bacterium]|nr:hypothetical protein [Simkaniaceae bacterium]
MATNITLDGSRVSTIYRLCEEKGSAGKTLSHRVAYLEELVSVLRRSLDALRAENQRLVSDLRRLEWTSSEKMDQKYQP